jgi:hypothetical protein
MTQPQGQVMGGLRIMSILLPGFCQIIKSCATTVCPAIKHKTSVGGIANRMSPSK